MVRDVVSVARFVVKVTVWLVEVCWQYLIDNVMFLAGLLSLVLRITITIFVISVKSDRRI